MSNRLFGAYKPKFSSKRLLSQILILLSVMSAQEENKLSSVHLTIKFHAKETIPATIIAIALRLPNLLLKLHPGLVQKIQNLKNPKLKIHRKKRPKSQKKMKH